MLGVGLGFALQVLVLAVQNAVPYAQLGDGDLVGTLFRSIGGSLGTAILGAIFANRLSHELAAVPARPHARHRRRWIPRSSSRCRRRCTTHTSGRSRTRCRRSS